MMQQPQTKVERLKQLDEMLRDNQETVVYVHRLISCYMKQSSNDEDNYEIADDIISRKNILDEIFYNERLKIINE